MEYKGHNLCNGPTDPLATINKENKSEYKKVFHLLDELGFNDHEAVFFEHQFRDSTLAYIETEDELKMLLKEVGLPAGLVFAFVKLWFRYKDKPDVFLHDTDIASADQSKTSPSEHAEPVCNKYTQTDTAKTTNVGTQTLYLNSFPPPLSADPYELFNPFANLSYLTSRMPIPSNLPASAYALSPWPYNQMSNLYKDPSTHNNPAPGEIPGFGGLMNGFTDHNRYDPLENFNPHDHDDDGSGLPLEKNGSDISLDEKSSATLSNEYALFPDAEPLCSPKASHISAANDKDDAIMSRLRQAEQERDQRSYATALKDHHKEGQQSIPNGLPHDHLSSPGARSRSSSTASASNLSRSASSTDFHPLSPSRDSPEVSTKSSNYRSYVGIDDIDPRSNVNKSHTSVIMSNSTFSFFYENLPDSPEFMEAMKEKPPKAGWRPLAGKHEKSGHRFDFKPQYIDKDGRVRHGVRVRGALKSMECWLHTTSKPPMDCLFAHSRIGDTLEFICIRCSYEKGRNHECRDKKGHAAFICNLGPYRDVNGEKWRGKVDPSGQ